MRRGQPITSDKFINYSMFRWLAPYAWNTTTTTGNSPWASVMIRAKEMTSQTRIAEATDIQPEKVCEVVQLALEELHRIMIIDEKGPTAAVMEACFSFGGEAAFHLIGLFASEHAYHGRDDNVFLWREVAMRFIPSAYAEGRDRIAPWFDEKTAARIRLDTEIKNSSSSLSETDERDTGSMSQNQYEHVALIDEPNLLGTVQTWEQHLAELRKLSDNFALKQEMIKHAEAVIARKQQDRPFRPVAALAMGRALILSGLKHGDPRMARAGKKLLAKANAELDSPKGQTALFSELPSATNTSRGPSASPNLGGLAMDQKVQQFAAEHHRFLQESLPHVLDQFRNEGDLNSYLSSVGQTASDQYESHTGRQRGVVLPGRRWKGPAALPVSSWCPA